MVAQNLQVITQQSISSVVSSMWPGVMTKNDENLVQQPGLPLPPKNISTVLSSYSVSTGKETYKNHTFRVHNGNRYFFLLIMLF